MNNPELYRKAEVLKSDIKLFLDEYKSMVQWRTDGMDSLLDIGCAGGNVTIDLVHEWLPRSFSRLIGVDIKETMIDYAIKTYKLPKVSFEKLDIGGDVSDFLTKHEPFDHITSFLCIHLVPDQQRVMENIYKLLQPNGDCLLYILVDYPGFHIYKHLNKKWFSYMYDLDDFISPYSKCFNPEYLLKKYLSKAGFSEYSIREREESEVYNDIQFFKDTYKSIMPFFHRIPTHEQDEFLDEYTKLAQENTKRNYNSDVSAKLDVEQNIIYHHKMFTVYARK